MSCPFMAVCASSLLLVLMLDAPVRMRTIEAATLLIARVQRNPTTCWAESAPQGLNWLFVCFFQALLFTPACILTHAPLRSCRQLVVRPPRRLRTELTDRATVWTRSERCGGGRRTGWEQQQQRRLQGALLARSMPVSFTGAGQSSSEAHPRWPTRISSSRSPERGARCPGCRPGCRALRPGLCSSGSRTPSGEALRLCVSMLLLSASRQSFKPPALQTDMRAPTKSSSKIHKLRC